VIRWLAYLIANRVVNGKRFCLRTMKYEDTDVLNYVIAEYKIADGTCSFDLKPSTLKEIMAFPAGTMI
jgi:hypothetical protein